MYIYIPGCVLLTVFSLLSLVFPPPPRTLLLTLRFLIVRKIYRYESAPVPFRFSFCVSAVRGSRRAILSPSLVCRKRVVFRQRKKNKTIKHVFRLRAFSTTITGLTAVYVCPHRSCIVSTATIPRQTSMVIDLRLGGARSNRRFRPYAQFILFSFFYFGSIVKPTNGANRTITR